MQSAGVSSDRSHSGPGAPRGSYKLAREGKGRIGSEYLGLRPWGLGLSCCVEPLLRVVFQDGMKDRLPNSMYSLGYVAAVPGW